MTAHGLHHVEPATGRPVASFTDLIQCRSGWSADAVRIDGGDGITFSAIVEGNESGTG